MQSALRTQRSRPGAAPAGALLVTLLCSCSRGASENEAADPVTVQRDIRDLLTALRPPAGDALPVEKSRYHAQRRETLERLRSADRAHGQEALRTYLEEPPALAEMRAGLLDVAAHAAPEDTRPVLVELVTTFGEDIYVRTQACEYLGETAPETALEVFTPLLSGRVDGRTYPPEERLLSAWVTASEKLGRDPVALLATIATDIQRPQEVRHLATRALGAHDGPQSRQALQVILVESSGNGYIRRLATQSLRQLLSKEEFCELVESVQSREADLEFLRFLEDARQKNCG